MDIANVKTFEQRVLWDVDYDTKPFWIRWPIEVMRAIMYVVGEFASGDLNLRAMSLVYTTIMSLVPLLAFSFSVLKGFGVQNQLEPLLFQYLTPLGPEKAGEISTQIVAFVTNIDVRVLGAAGLGLLIYTIVTLMKKIEAAFNFVWRISRDRAFPERFTTFLSVLTVGPLLVFAAMGITGSVMSNSAMQALAGVQPFGHILRESGRVVPYVLIISAFTFIYALVPNTKVRFVPALCGGIVAGLLWETAGIVFAYFVSGATKYQAVYATFGTIIFFMIWMYVSWLILLVGASVAFYAQDPRSIVARARRWCFTAEGLEKLALRILILMTRNQYAGKPPLSTRALSETLALPPEMTENALEVLEGPGAIRQTTATEQAWVLAVPPDETPVVDMFRMVRRYHSPLTRALVPTADATTDKIWERIDGAFESALKGHTLKSLALDKMDETSLQTNCANAANNDVDSDHA